MRLHRHHPPTPAEQRAIVNRMIVGTIRYWARRQGYPEPVIVEQNVKPLKGGGYVTVEGSDRPLRPEYGGDGRTLADAMDEARRGPLTKTSLKLVQAVERHKAALAAAGIEVVVVDPSAPEPESKTNRASA